jgi:MtN3 and saliva related transmembrane protein
LVTAAAYGPFLTAAWRAGTCRVRRGAGGLFRLSSGRNDSAVSVPGMQWSLIDAIGATGAVLTTVCWLPQAAQIIRERETRAISLPATSLFTLGIVLWLVYGLALGDWPLIGSNAVTLALMLLIVGLKLRHG